MVPAFAARQRLVPGQVKVAETSNKIVGKKADYVLALTGNRGLLERVGRCATGGSLSWRLPRLLSNAWSPRG